MRLGERFRKARENADLSQGQVALYAETGQGYLSDLESGKRWPSTWTLLTRLSEQYQVSTDYLLGLTDNPLPRTDTPIPDAVLAVMELAVDMSSARQDELLAHARVLIDAQRAANLSEYDRLLAMFAASEDGPELVEMVEDLLRAVTAGDTTRAQRLLVDILAGRGEDTQESEQ